MRIDLDWLRAQGVRCDSELVPFAAAFPDGAEVTRETLHRAAATGRHLDWLAHKILEPADLVVFLERAGALRRAAEAARDESYARHHASAALEARGVVVDASAGQSHLRDLDDIKRAHEAALADLLADVLQIP
jgi:hypothetical protein